tara:strand:+ start:315 stop:725 length:411 start_codon:yes stop_codon:yes gene_type:complete
MEDNRQTEALGAFTKKYVKEIKQEQPSLDFTTSIMQTIAKESTAKVFKSTVLISKKVWFVISVFVLAAVFIPFKTSYKGLINLPKVDLSFFDKIQIPNLFESFSVSNTVLYSVFFFGLMIMAQVVFLKNYFNKRFE